MKKYKIKKNNKGNFIILERKKFLIFEYWTTIDFVSAGMDATYISFPIEFQSEDDAQIHINKLLK